MPHNFILELYVRNYSLSWEMETALHRSILVSRNMSCCTRVMRLPCHSASTPGKLCGSAALPFLSGASEHLFCACAVRLVSPANQHPAKRISSHMDHLGYCLGTSQACISHQSYQQHSLLVPSQGLFKNNFFFKDVEIRVVDASPLLVSLD